jgi:hypothetical protein
LIGLRRVCPGPHFRTTPEFQERGRHVPR